MLSKPSPSELDPHAYSSSFIKTFLSHTFVLKLLTLNMNASSYTSFFSNKIYYLK